MRKYTLIFTLLGSFLCAIHLVGLDPKHMLLFSFSPPLWFLPIVVDPFQVSRTVLYLLTVASWALIGYVIDRFVYSRRAKA